MYFFKGIRIDQLPIYRIFCSVRRHFVKWSVRDQAISKVFLILLACLLFLMTLVLIVKSVMSRLLLECIA